MTHIPGRRRDQYFQGLYQRYEVKKNNPADDGPDDPKAIYFVLRLDAEGKDESHVKACQAAALEFARRTNNKHLADDVRRVVAEQVGIMAVKAIAREIAEVVGEPTKGQS